MSERTAIIEAYAAQGIEAVSGKGGFWLRDSGFVSLAQARKATGVDLSQKRAARASVGPWGEYAWIAAANGAL